MKLIISIDDTVADDVLKAFAYNNNLPVDEKTGEAISEQAWLTQQINQQIMNRYLHYKSEIAAKVARENGQEGIRIEVESVTPKNAEAVDTLIAIDKVGLTIDIPAVTAAVGFTMPEGPISDNIEKAIEN